VSSVPDPTDLEQLREDIAKVKKAADFVVVSFHWGDFMRPFHLTDHELKTARLCIDLGVDFVVGHHHHALRGMEFYKGKPILYGLGHFVFDFEYSLNTEAEKMFRTEDGYGIAPRKGWPLLPLHPDTRMTLLAYAQIGKDRPTEVGFLPCWLTPEGPVVPYDAKSPKGREVVDYMTKCNTTQGLNGVFVSDGGIELGGYATARLVPLTKTSTD
jgi:poly-gamma-glutamate synthesis protein (capsule biosynthesis protein)